MKWIALPGLLGVAAVAWGWQEGLSKLGLDPGTFEERVRAAVYAATGGTASQITPPAIGKQAAEAGRALNDGARAALVRELGLAAKKLVMSPAFAAAHDKHIENSANAVNHGIAVQDAQSAAEKAIASGNAAALESAMANVMRDNFRNMVADRLKQKDIEKYDQNMLGIMVETDLSMVDMAATTPADKAAAAKAKPMYAEAKKLAATDLPKARETFRAASMLAAGLKDESAGAAMQADKKKQEQQINYNKYSLKPVLKARLGEFVELARTVDFAAQTQPKAGRQVFVRQDYERRPALWKFLFRLGPGGTKEAVAIAQAWAREL